MKVAVIYNRSDVTDSDVINVFGLQTRERYSPQLVEKVAAALEKGGHNVRIVDGNMQVIEALQNFMPRVVRGERPGMVFNMAYGIQGQSRYTHIPSMLEMLGIPYVGSGPAGHAIALDKVMSKIVFLRNNLPTPAFWVFSGPQEDLGGVAYPVIVKPRSEAVSFGLRVVRRDEDLRKAVAEITSEFQQQALAEEFIPGREFCVGLLGNEPQLETLPIVEIDLEGDPEAIQTAEDKARTPRRKICPADLPEPAAEEMRRLARGAFNALGLNDFSRVDIRMDREGGLHILEINSMASLNLTGSLVQSARVAGMDFPALVNRILDVAAVRCLGDSGLHHPAGGVRNGRPEALHARIRSHIRSHVTTVTDAIRQMVSIDTHVHNVDGVNALGTWISDRFHHLGFHRKTYRQTEVGNLLYFRNHEEDRNDVLLLGHMDTTYDALHFAPFREEGGRLYGPGVAESKGGIALILAALQALRFARVLRQVRCGVLLTPDDSLSGRFSQETILALALRSGHVMGMKYGDPGGGIVVSCSGEQPYHVEIANVKNNHRNQKSRKAPNVVGEISERNLAWLALAAAHRDAGITIDSVSAETRPGANPDRAEAALTVRFNDKRKLEEIDREIRRIAEEGADKSLQVKLRMGERRPPVPDSELNRRFFERVRGLAEVLETTVEPVHRPSSSDICHVPDGVPVLGGFGPVGGDPRSPGEYVLRDSLIDRAALLALVIHGCGRKDRGGA